MELIDLRILPNIGIFASIIFAILTVIITIVFVVPLQLKAVRIKNGLVPLRRMLLEYGIFFIVTNTIALILLIFLAHLYLYEITDRNATFWGQALILLFTFVGFLKAIWGLRMYRLQFSEEGIAYHERLEETEKKYRSRFDIHKK